jgi:hypothetical protein
MILRMFCEILGSHTGGYEDGCHLGCCGMQSDRYGLMFQMSFCLHHHISNFLLVVLGGAMVIMFAIEPKGQGFNPGQER